MMSRRTLAIGLLSLCTLFVSPLPSMADPSDKAAKEAQKEKMKQEREAQKKQHEAEREARKDKEEMEREDRKHKEEMEREGKKKN